MSSRRAWLKKNEKAVGNDIVNTKSTHFIMPMIGWEITDFLSVTEHVNHLINCHLDTKRERIVLVIDNVKDKNILDFLTNNESNPYFINSKLDDDDREIVLEYEVPSRFKEDYGIFLSSKYSKMSEVYKKKLIEIYGRKTNKGDYRPTQFDVIYPTSFKRRQLAEELGVSVDLLNEVEELTSKLNLDYEEYKNIKELLKTTLLTNNKIEPKECEKQ